MNHEFSRLAAAAVERYGHFLNILRSQSDSAFRRGATNEEVRNQARSTSADAARKYLGVEHGWLNEDTADVARAAYRQARVDLGFPDPGITIEDRFADFIFEAAAFAVRILAAQVERDLVSLMQHMRQTAQRVDLYARSGRHTISSASAAVMLEDNQTPAFRFMDRLGRRFKSSKHVRDTYRAHLLHIYNEVYMDVVADHGHESVLVWHPDPNFKWFEERLAIVSSDAELPLYYDVKEEVFHPGSDAIVSIKGSA